MTRRVFLTLCGTAPLAAAEPWERRPFPDWSKETIDRLLTDSPWAKPLAVPFEYQPPPERLRSDFGQVSVPGRIGLPSGVPDIGLPPGAPRRRPRSTDTGRPGGPPKVRTEANLTIRWSSALPIRQALALTQWGREGLQDPKAVEFLKREEPDYILEIFGVPVILAPHGTERLEETLARTSRLSMEGRRPAPPSAVHIPEQGYHLSAEMRFPRFDRIGPEDGSVELSAEAGPLKIARAFRLKSMVYQGRLAL